MEPLIRLNANWAALNHIMKTWALGLTCGIVVSLFTAAASGEEKWAIHEWGTFTSLQNEQGEAIGGINTDDEPVPKFVHRLADFLLLRPTELPATFFQGAPRCHPDVTMRLETPVIYFNPPKSEKKIYTADVEVKFRGGWLTEFFPDAIPDAPGLKNGWDGFPHLLSSTESKLVWNDLKIGGDWPLTNTAEHVWTSPRAVHAASVQTSNGESEKFLFYRGVANINAPLKVSRDAPSGELLFRSQLEDLRSAKPLKIPAIWLVDIQQGGKIAFRQLPPLSLDNNAKKILTHTPAVFKSDDFSTGNSEKLKASLQKALVADGLFADEALALLNTWELSYFKSSGLRVFFIVPREWTDFYLPLKISQRAEINRVMVGRIELVTPEQRLGLQKIASFSTSEIMEQATQFRTNYYSSLGTSRSASPSFPKTYQTYLDLGRFRNALILDEAKASPTVGLTNFISTYRLEAYKPL
jgi:hypothetical protein